MPGLQAEDGGDEEGGGESWRWQLLHSEVLFSFPKIRGQLGQDEQKAEVAAPVKELYVPRLQDEHTDGLFAPS